MKKSYLASTLLVIGIVFGIIGLWGFLDDQVPQQLKNWSIFILCTSSLVRALLLRKQTE